MTEVIAGAPQIRTRGLSAAGDRESGAVTQRNAWPRQRPEELPLATSALASWFFYGSWFIRVAVGPDWVQLADLPVGSAAVVRPKLYRPVRVCFTLRPAGLDGFGITGTRNLNFSDFSLLVKRSEFPTPEFSVAARRDRGGTKESNHDESFCPSMRARRGRGFRLHRTAVSGTEPAAPALRSRSGAASSAPLNHRQKFFGFHLNHSIKQKPSLFGVIEAVRSIYGN